MATSSIIDHYEEIKGKKNIKAFIRALEKAKKLSASSPRVECSYREPHGDELKAIWEKLL